MNSLYAIYFIFVVFAVVKLGLIWLQVISEKQFTEYLDNYNFIGKTLFNIQTTPNIDPKNGNKYIYINCEQYNYFRHIFIDYYTSFSKNSTFSFLMRRGIFQSNEIGELDYMNKILFDTEAKLTVKIGRKDNATEMISSVNSPELVFF